MTALELAQHVVAGGKTDDALTLAIAVIAAEDHYERTRATLAGAIASLEGAKPVDLDDVANGVVDELRAAYAALPSAQIPST